MFIGTLFIDKETGYETFYHGANVPFIYANKKECEEMGYVYYRGECFAVKAKKIIEKPVEINGRIVYYVYIEGEEDGS